MGEYGGGGVMTLLIRTHPTPRASVHELRTELGTDTRETRTDGTEPPTFLIVGSNHRSFIIAEQRDVDSTRYVS